MFEGLVLPAAADMHIHLRDNAMCETVTPLIRHGGVDLVYVMPNLVPPVTTTNMAMAYRAKLQKLAPEVRFLMSLYLHPSLTRAEIIAAKQAGISGVKAYPAGVTTHSAAGVLDWSVFDGIFAEMQEQDLVLNIHGECPSDGKDVTVLNAEERFLPLLHQIHSQFPRLRIILEHCSSAAALDAVRSCGPNVVGTITAHHLMLTVDDWAGDGMNWCKPAAKFPQDRAALLQAAVANDPKFFFGSDSAPHSLAAKRGTFPAKQAAGVFTSPHAIALVLEAFEQAVQQGLLRQEQLKPETLAGFLSHHGRQFYKEPESNKKVRLSHTKDQKVQSFQVAGTEDTLVPFRHGAQLRSLTWISS